MSFSSSLVRFNAIMSNSSVGTGKLLQYYPVHKFNKMEFNEKKQHMKFQKATRAAPVQSKYNKFNNLNANKSGNTSSSNLVVDDA